MSVLGSLTVKLVLNPAQFRDGLVRARTSLGLFKGSVDDGSKSTSSFSGLLDKLAPKLKEAALAGLKMASAAGAIASTALTLAPAIGAAVKWTTSFVQSGAAAAPMLLGMAAAGLFVKATFTRIMPDILKAFNPFMAALTDAGNRAGLLASAGIAPLTQKFAQLNMPAISSGMNEIATSTNKVVKGTLAWANSTAGVMAIRNIVQSAGDAFAFVSPHIERVVIALGNMLGRITAVSTAAGASGLSGVLDKVAAYLDKVDAASVLKGLDGLKTSLGQVVQFFKDLAHWVSNAIEFYKTFKTEIQLVGTALSILAIVTGGPVVAVIAAVGLIIKYWDQLKAAYQAFVGYFTNNPVGVGFLDNLRSASESVLGPLKKAWDSIWSAIGPVLTQIWDKIQNQFIPAMGKFIAAIAPVVGFMIDVLGPIIASVWAGILDVISGAISIITGIIQVFTALLTGDWQGAWDGVKNICSGVGQIITGIISAVFGGLAGIVGGGIDAVIGIIAHLPGTILAALGGLGSLLYNAGTALIQGLINGIKDMLGAVGSAASSVASTIRSYLPFSPAKRGPLSGQGSPQLAGQKIASMLTSGMLDGLPAVVAMSDRLAGAINLPSGDALNGLTAPRGVASTASAGSASTPPVVHLQGTDAILQLMRKLVRDNGGSSEVAFARSR